MSAQTAKRSIMITNRAQDRRRKEGIIIMGKGSEQKGGPERNHLHHNQP